MTRRLVPLVLAVVVAVGFLPPASAGACGEVALAIMNPDLQPQADGFVHAGGALLVQVRPEGADADAVTRMDVAIGAHVPDAARACGAPLTLTGAYALESREDATPRDGFFLPVNSTRFVDGDYGLVLRAFDASGTEVARRVLDARFQNGRASPADPASMDRSAPWPRVLPGDGDQSHAEGGLTIEFAERVASVSARVNEAPVALEAWTPPPGASGAPVLAGSVPVTGYRYAGGVEAGDVVRVSATDLSGNRVEKSVRVGGSPASGTSGDAGRGAADIALGLPGGREHTGAPGAALDVLVNVTNPGGREARVLLSAQAPSVLNATLASGNVTVLPNATANATVRVSVDANASAGEYSVIVLGTWTEAGEERSRTVEFLVLVSSTQAADPVDAPRREDANATGAEGNGTAPGDALDAGDADADTQDAGAARASPFGVPAPGVPALVLTALVAGALARRARRT